MRRVIKFGGTSIATGELIRAMAMKIKSLKNKGDDNVVVVSAMGKRTGELYDLLNTVTDKKVKGSIIDEVVSLGEELSANLMAASLESLNQPAQAIKPEDEFWPIWGQAVKTRILSEEKTNQEGYATIDLMRTQAKCLQYLEPLLKSGVIPVVCGFLAKNDDGQVITLGRGGSDITAFVLGRCLAADEVVIITDVTGVMKADPKRFKGQRHLEKITIKDLIMMARGGARIVHPGALLYKLPQQLARIVHFESKRFNTGGTEILGNIKPEVRKTLEKLAFITCVGNNFISTVGILNKITEQLVAIEVPIFGVSISEQYIGVYVPESMVDESYNRLFQICREDKHFKAVSMRKGIARLKVSSSAFVEEPGVIGRLGDLLAEQGINILEMVTIHTDITIFLEAKDFNKAYNILKDVAI